RYDKSYFPGHIIRFNSTPEDLRMKSNNKLAVVKLLLAILVFSKLPVISGSKNGMNARFSFYFIRILTVLRQNLILF
ncbi:MAG TPA: hypothetical protein VF700_01410, partial [Segetibacter sp.]